MHSVERSPEPDFFPDLRAKYSRWDELEGEDRWRIRDALAQDFSAVCGYCEQPCQLPTAMHEGRAEETVDHFRPRNHFPAEWLDWANLVYACRRCNQAKGGSWPGFDDDFINQALTAGNSWYVPISQYVNPNTAVGQMPAEDFFAFNTETGEILPSAQLDRMEWSMARRTIHDIDLNDSALGENDESHLWNRRLEQRALLTIGASLRGF